VDPCLDWTQQQTEDFIGTIPVKYYSLLPEDRIIPPKGAWVLASDTRPGVTGDLTGVKKGEDRMKDGTDKRIIYEVPRADWCRRIGNDESVILKDKDTRAIAGIVYRSFIGVPSAIARMDEAAKEHVTMGRNARVCHLIQAASAFRDGH